MISDQQSYYPSAVVSDQQSYYPYYWLKKTFAIRYLSLKQNQIESLISSICRNSFQLLKLLENYHF